jgi:hypothetical protein
MNALNQINIQIHSAQWHIEKAINTRDTDRFNTYYSILSNLYKERREILKLKVIGG